LSKGFLQQVVKWRSALGRPAIDEKHDESPLLPVELALLNAKFAGYEMARRLASERPERTVAECPRMDLASKASTQFDLESDWCAYWTRELGLGFAYHRKLWELTYVLQALYDNDCLQAGKRGVVFGCGRESLPSYCAARGINILATDLPASSTDAQGWIDTDQHADSLEELHHPHLCTLDQLRANVERRAVDMNAIPSDLEGYDFCWSICALEHLGSIEQGLAFVEESLKTLKPGGVAVHTTEFAFLNIARTLDQGSTVLFLRSHFEELQARLERAGHWLAPFDFHPGDGPMDKFIDGPPFPGDKRSHLLAPWPQSYHLKVCVEGVPSTCFGLIIRKRR
jgi:2-polyprenyl-3-methyl-5-hydroxy-6-metoxy-1,4-benzoquinol methylase